MDATSLLLDRLQILRWQLDQVQAAIVGARAGEADWAQKEFAHQIADQSSNLDREIKRARAESDAWHDVAVRTKACKPLFREVLAYLQATGGAPHGTGPALLARALVVELREASGLGVTPLIVPDVDDSFSDFVQIIRLRFPPADIWDVPVVAHEFGHFAAYRLTAAAYDGLQRPQAVREFIAGYLEEHEIKLDAEKEKWTFRLNEFFADMFATYMLGPSFVASSLLLRFDVADAYNDDDPKHPSYAARAQAILRTLRQMSQDGHGQFKEAIEGLEEQWSGLLRFASRPSDLKWVNDIARELYAVVRSVARNAQYANWKYVDQNLRFVVGPPLRRPEGNISVRDLLNAAWLARANGQNPTAINDRALQLWQEQEAMNAAHG